MANPLPNEIEFYEQIEREGIIINPEIWDLLYNRIGDDVTAINLICQYALSNSESVPVSEGHKILQHTQHIRDIVNKLTVPSKEKLDFPEFINDIPLHPIIREMFTHYIGNDVYMINLIVGDTIDPADPKSIPPDLIQKVLGHTRTIREFMYRLRDATSQGQKRKDETPSSIDKKSINASLSKEELFLSIRNLLAEEFNLKNTDKIKPESRFGDDLGLDSVDAIRVIMVLEDAFGFEIPDADAEGVFSVGQAVDYVFKRLKKERRRIE